MTIEEPEDAQVHTQKWKATMLKENKRVDNRVSDINRRAAELSLLERVNNVTHPYGLNFKNKTIQKQKTKELSDTGTLE